MEVTATFKYTKTDLVRQGYDPAATADAIYFNHPEQKALSRRQMLYKRIQAGQVHPGAALQRRRGIVLANPGR